jgi:TrpR-related protein YerC/YecD
MTTGGDWQNDDTDALFTAVLSLEDTAEAARFFRDLCTLRELEEMAQRWRVVRLLERGLPYREISGETGCSTATVTRIAQWLRHGEGGYRMVLDRLGLAAENGS